MINAKEYGKMDLRLIVLEGGIYVRSYFQMQRARLLELAQSVAEEVNMLCEGCQVDYHDEWYDRVLAVYKGAGIPY